MIEIRLGTEHTDFETVHAWLGSTYWSPGIPRETVEKAARHSSLVVNVYEDGRQVGYCRVVSDKTTFAWLCDVFVAESSRGRGVAKRMIAAAIADPEHQGLRRWLLATKDAHALYAQQGFKPLPSPERWMFLSVGG